MDGTCSGGKNAKVSHSSPSKKGKEDQGKRLKKVKEEGVVASRDLEYNGPSMGPGSCKNQTGT